MFNWQVKQEMTAQNAIFLAEIGDNNGRPFKSRFLQAGLVKYDFGVCLLKKETIDKFVNTFINQPVIIGHKDTIIERDVVGYVHNIWFSPEDGWFWCDGTLKDEEAIKLVEEKGFNVSCQYRITEYTNNEEDKLHNGNPYDKEIINGIFEHLALVECPRYEDAFIAVNAYIAENEFKEEEHPRDEEGKFTEKANVREFGGLEEEKFNKIVKEWQEISKKEKQTPQSIKKSQEYIKYFIEDAEYKSKDQSLNEPTREYFKNQVEKLKKQENLLEDWFDLSKHSPKYMSEIWKKHLEKKPEEFKNHTASNSFVEVFRNMLYETLAEGIYERLGELKAVNFDESKINRDEKGRFARKNSVQFTSQEEKQKKIDSINIDLTKDNILPELNKEEQSFLGIKNYPVRLKKSIIERNQKHNNVNNGDDNYIIGSALYNPENVLPAKTKGYYHFIKRVYKDRNSIVLLDINVNENDKCLDIVHYYYINDKGRRKTEKNH